MINNYFKIALRYVYKEGIYSIIKIFGLAIGLATLLVIALFVYEDLSFDGFHKKKDRIVRLLTIDSAQGVQSQEVGVSQPAFGPAAVEEIPEIENYARVLGGGEFRLRRGDEEFRVENTFFTESTFFEVFDFEIINGQKEGALDEPNTVILTESLAKRIFDDEDPIGKSLQLDDTELNIKAVMKDPPSNSHLQFEILRSLVAPEDNPGWQQFLTSWGGLSIFNYMLLDQPREDLQPIIAKLTELKEKNEAAEFFNPTLQPLKDVHLRSKHILFESNYAKTDISNVYIMISIGVIVLILACVNFMNLVTAKSTHRGKEMGIRKVMGGLKRQLIFQHLTETLVIVLMASVIAFVLVLLTVPLLKDLYDRNADIVLFQTPLFIYAYLLFVFVITLISGSYPSFVLSSFSPSSVLKGAFKSGKSGIFIRKTLVILQFSISIALISGSFIIFQQMEYIRSMDMGYDRDQIINLQLPSQIMVEQSGPLKEKLSSLSTVVEVGSSSSQIGSQLGRTGIFPEGSTEDDNYITSIMNIDDRYIPAMQMEILDGRNFSREVSTDTANSMIINEELARLLKWEDPVGKTISLGPEEDRTEYNIIGLVKDFNFATVQHSIEPLFMLYSIENPNISIKISSNDLQGTINQVESIWNEVYPQNLFEYSFLDEDFEQLYRSETAFARMFSHLTFLAIFIAVIGLFALSAFAAEQRTKEIGIRKVLGAKVNQIVLMLSKEFIILVGIAFIISIPIAWYGMNAWLESFYYRVDINVAVFLISAALSGIVAMVTISWQSLKAAIVNPAISLRSE